MKEFAVISGLFMVVSIWLVGLLFMTLYVWKRVDDVKLRLDRRIDERVEAPRSHLDAHITRHAS